MQPYSLRGLRGPAPPGPSFSLRLDDRPGGHRPPCYFLCKQKVTKKLPKPEVLDSSCLICFAPVARSGWAKLVRAAYLDFCVYLGVFSG